MFNSCVFRIGILWIKIITAIYDTHMRLFFESATGNFTILVVECSYWVFVSGYSEGDFITTIATFNATFMPVFNFFSHPIFAVIIYVGFKIKILSVYSSYFSAPATSNENIF